MDTDEEIFSPAADPVRAGPVDLERPTAGRPMIHAAAALITGLALGRSLLLPPWSLILPALGAVAWGALELARPRGRRRPPSGWVLLVPLFLTGWAVSNRVIRTDADSERLAEAFGDYALSRIQGRVARPAALSPTGFAFELDDVGLASAPGGPGVVSFPLKVLVQGPAPEGASAAEGMSLWKGLPRPGQWVVVWGRVSAPKLKAHPADFDQRRYLRGRGIGAVVKLRSDLDIETTGRSSGWRAGIQRAGEGLRRWMMRNVESAVGGHQAGVIEALCLGERAALSPELNEAFLRTGLVHILSVSGLHTGFVLALALALLRAVGLRPRACAAGAALLVLAYAVLTGMRPPVVRASVLGCFLMGAWAIGRTPSILSGTATAALVTLAYDPRNLARADWQLSYLCVLSIALFAGSIYDLPFGLRSRLSDSDAGDGWIRRLRRLISQWVWLPLAVVLSIQLGMLPVQIGLFGQFSLIGLVIQPLALVAAAMIVWAGVLLGLIGWLPGLNIVIGGPTGFVVTLFEGLIERSGALRWAALAVPAMPLWAAGGYYLTLLVGPHLRPGLGLLNQLSRRQRAHVAARLALLAVAVAWWPVWGSAGAGVAAAIEGPLASAPDSGSWGGSAGRLEVYVLDVGQGDSIVLRLPGGETVVVDCGGAGRGPVGPSVEAFLERLGVWRIDLMVATHGHADHTAGLPYLIEHFEVGLVLHGPDALTSPTSERLQEAIVRHGTPTLAARAGHRIEGSEGVEIRVLHPAPGFRSNDASVVLVVDYDEIEIALTGDVESAGERTIVEEGYGEDVEALKVAHHGSRTSTTEAFLEAFRPEVAMISVGEANRYGHPAGEVLRRLEDRGVTVARTDLMGTIRLRTDGRRLEVSRFVP